MKRIIIFLLIILNIFTSCSKREIEVIYLGSGQIINSNNDDDDDDDDDENVAIVGDDYICGSSISSVVPAKYNGFGSNSWSVVIYKAEDIDYDDGGTINTLSYLIDCKPTACVASPVTNQRVFFKLTAQDDIISTNHPDLNSMTQVYNGAISWKSGTTINTSWTDIILDNTFNYDGSSNIMVYFENGNNNTVGGILSCVGETPAYIWDYLGENRSLHATYNSDPSNPASTPFIDTITPITKFTFN